MTCPLWRRLALAAALTLAPAFPQDILKQLDLKAMAAKAKETVEVNLDGNLLTLAARFLSDKNADEAEVKAILKDIKGIYVRSFEFDREGGYTMADVDAVRNQASGPGWQRVVDVKGSKENTGIYLKSMNGEKVDGVVVLAAERNEFTVVQIVGSIDPARLSALSGKFGIPKLPGTEGVKKSTNKKDD